MLGKCKVNGYSLYKQVKRSVNITNYLKDFIIEDIDFGNNTTVYIKHKLPINN